MIKYSDLNNEQRMAVVDDSKHLRIIAGAGSGKTRVLTMRIVYLIEKKHVNPRHILAITFTNKAANEMKKRISEMLGEEGDGCFISTIHSLCLRILKEEIEILGYPKNFTVVDADDQKTILKEAYKENNIEKNEISYAAALDYIANCKYAGISYQNAIEQAYGDPSIIKKAKVYEYYQERLKQVYGLDFDDLILWTTKLFKLYPNVLEKWSKRFEFIHVDEFQDIDKEQYLLIKQLSTYHDNVYVVGDPDQTIYTWRGADVNIIVNFDTDFKDTKTIILNQNYRSTNNILEGANSVIKNNKSRVKKDLYSNNGDGEKIIHKTLASETAEAYYVVDEIRKLKRKDFNYSDIAILYRSNYLSREIEKVLMENHMPYIIYGGLRFYERMEVKDILSYLRLIVNGDDLAFQRVINQPKRGIGPKSIETILKIAQKENITMYEVIKRGLYAKKQDVFDNFVSMVEKWKEILNDGLELDKFLNRVLDDSGYRTMLEKDSETERLENVKALIDDITEYQKTYAESSLEDYLQMVSLYTDKANLKDEDSLNLLTIHAAKGLEFPVVFVIGLSEGVFPSQRTLQEGSKGIEEERRLAYVAYTRAKQLLYLTDSSSFSYVLESSKLPSRFINEIDDKYINHLDKQEKKESIFDVDFFSDDKKVEPIINTRYKKGDVVIHGVFGEGVVIKIDGQILEIAFSYPYGIKKILASHPSIRKKEANDYN
ncbi:MAG: UvrD-helicase domain-containing protein [Erysipelotrichaceae bacterium]|nr:UvrD-helicase domain-containing protein [Erysipelotrichaceae bacterium]